MKKTIIVFSLMIILLSGCSLKGKSEVVKMEENNNQTLEQIQTKNEDEAKPDLIDLQNNNLITATTTELAAAKTLEIKVFFPNSIMDPNFMDCNVVHPITKTIPYTVATARAALNELIKGLSLEEKNAGFQTMIGQNVSIKSLAIKGETAYVDFSKELQNTNVGLCAGMFIQAQIRQTLLQFPTIKSVVVSIDGNSDFVQP